MNSTLDIKIQEAASLMKLAHASHVSKCRKSSLVCTWCSRYFSVYVENHRALCMEKYVSENCSAPKN